MAETDDLATLLNLSEETLLSSLKSRYEAGKIYTYVGDILLAVNPYAQLDIYSKQNQRTYTGPISKAERPPHIYYTANSAYELMLRTKRDQCFVISGESGAGKTETTKFIVNHVIELCKAGRKTLESNILQVNPLLEAFGNAKTVMNDNSSRFGKYLELDFDGTGAVTGGRISEYLLEKSRVTMPKRGERNFHFFYLLFAGLGPVELGDLGLSKPSKHHYLKSEPAVSDEEIMNEKNRERYFSVIATMDSMNFAEEDKKAVISSIAAILHLGDTTFEQAANDSASITSPKEYLRHAAVLLHVSPVDLETALLTSSSSAGGEVIKRNYTVEKANDNRDAMAKSIYARLFGWLISQCNDLLADQKAQPLRALSLGILDIFGFETFESNSLEQLCINITNEQLQSYFNTFIFAMEQEAYRKEGVPFDLIEFKDNQATLDLFLKKPTGMLPLLDEESRVPKATDLSYTEKLAILKSHPSGAFIPARSNQDLSFSIEHYAGAVSYNSLDFLEKNRDSLSKDVTQLLQGSRSKFVVSLFKSTVTRTGSFRNKKGQAGASKKSTMCGHFAQSLEDLMTKLNKADPLFVRCLKPNLQKAKGKFDDAMVSKQLRYAGVLETVTIRKNGWSVRETFADFVKRYKSLCFKYNEEAPHTKASCIKILETTGLKDWAIGNDLVFLKFYHPDALMLEKRKHGSALVFVQKVMRGYICRMRYRVIHANIKKQKQTVSDFLSNVESGGSVSRAKLVAQANVDNDMKGKRKWVAKMQKKAEKLEKKQQKENDKKALKITKTKAKISGGGHVWQRNENLTIRVGKLPEHWEKKKDEATGRTYFKNHKTRQTTWVDPRSAVVRKKDARDTVGDELPYGWDEAETDAGEVYYINHNTQSTSWLHPRLLLEEKRQEYEKKQKQTEAKAETRRRTIKGYREKIQRLEQLRLLADEDDISDIEARIAAMDEVIAGELIELNEITTENAELRKEIKVLKKEFERAEHEQAHGEGTYDEDDVQDLYPVNRQYGTLPRPLDTMQRKRFGKSRKSNIEAK